MASKIELLTLHKYFLNASLMKSHFDRQSGLGVNTPDLWVYLSLWYGCLRVVIEGWQTLKLNDPSLDQLLIDEKIILLNGFRNDTFHFKHDYVSARSLRLLADKDFVDWIRNVHDPIGFSILKQLKTK